MKERREKGERKGVLNISKFFRGGANFRNWKLYSLLDHMKRRKRLRVIIIFVELVKMS